MDFDTVNFISEVKKRPALWDRKCTDYADRFIKMKCWEEIIEIYSKDSDSPREKRELGKVLSKKWRNIKDNFVKATKNLKAGAGSKQKSPYTYYNNLLFLKKLSSVNDSGSNITNDASESDEANETSQNIDNMRSKRSKNEDNIANDSSQNYDDRYERSHDISNPKRSKQSKSEDCTTNDNSQNYDSTYETSRNSVHSKRSETSQNENDIGHQLISLLNKNFLPKTDMDDDRLFLLSLLSEFKKIPDANKLDARCEIIKAIKNAQQSTVSNNPNTQWDRRYRGDQDQVCESEDAGSDASNTVHTIKLETE